MACSFPTSSTYGVSGFPGTPEEYMTSYPLSSATGGPLGPSAGPAPAGVCCADGEKSGPCSAIGEKCVSGGKFGDCVSAGNCVSATAAHSLPIPEPHSSWILYGAIVLIFLALLYFFLMR